MKTLEIDERCLLALCQPTTARRLRILRAHGQGMPLTQRAVRDRFLVSKATATRDLAALKRVLNGLQYPPGTVKSPDTSAVETSGVFYPLIDAREPQALEP